MPGDHLSMIPYLEKSYYTLFVDDFTRWSFVYFFESKKSQECTAAFKTMRSYIKKQFNGDIKRFHCDNGGGEYDNRLFKRELMQNGTQYKPAPPYTQHKNGVSVYGNEIALLL
jgi:hypothetical protein